MKCLATAVAIFLFLLLPVALVLAQNGLPPGPYYIAEGRQTSGPFSGDELAVRLGAGTVTADTQVWSPALAAWTRVGAVPALAPFLAAGPAAPPAQPPAVPPQTRLIGIWKSDLFTEVVQGTGLVETELEYTFWDNGDALLTVRYVGDNLGRRVDTYEVNGTFTAAAGNRGNLAIEVTGTATSIWQGNVTKREAIRKTVEWNVAPGNTMIDTSGAVFRWQSSPAAAKPPTPDPNATIAAALPTGSFQYIGVGVMIPGPAGAGGEKVRASFRLTMQIGPKDFISRTKEQLELRARLNESFVGTFSLQSQTEKTFVLFAKGEVTSTLVTIPASTQSPTPAGDTPPQFPQHSTTVMDQELIVTIKVIDATSIEVEGIVFKKIN